MNMRMPATPIFNIDPYLSVWAEESVLKNTVHWTGKPNTITGRVFVDGEEFHFLGDNKRGSSIKNMELVSVDIDAYSTVIIYKNDAVRLTAHFTAPLFVDDLYYASRPVNYCRLSYESLDGANHSVSARLTFSEELVLNLKGEGRALADRVDIEGLTAIKMGNGIQNPLNRSGDDVRIDWGYLYLAVKGEGKCGHTVLNGMYAAYIEAELNNDALFLLGYDDLYSIQYFGENLKAYWCRDGKTIQQALAEAAADYEQVLSRAVSFSEDLRAEAVKKGGEKYAELLLLSVRQIMAAHKIVVDKEDSVLFISKECFSNGCAATVDVTYPSAPIFLKYNVELLKGMLRPVMKYAESVEWEYDFAPHDVGQYPLVNGQVYGVKRKEGLAPVFNYNMQMPVEECGNMIILFSAICDVDDSVDFVSPYMETVKQWVKYLIEYGKDPEHQLCTDDFAGHLAHNVNLSIKAIMGIAAYSRMLERMGEGAEAERMMGVAREYAAHLIANAKNDDGSYRLAYDREGSFSLKYNSIWDKIWNTGIFPAEFFKGEVARYKKEMLPYGVPLDSREKYTKSDWLVWAASLADNLADFNAIVEPLWMAYNTMRTYAPMTDWYYCDTSDMRGFRHRTVQGGLFIKLMLD